jgi:hypothetical protein
LLLRINPDWRGETVVVAASGPSLVSDLAWQCRGFPVIAVNDACRIFTNAHILYACDARWWNCHAGAGEFHGERWSCHGERADDKRSVAEQYGIKLIRGSHGNGFSFDPGVIHYGGNSGFQAVNIALHKIGWHGRIILLGFDMRSVDGKKHFFGDHPLSVRRHWDEKKFRVWIKKFDKAARMLPDGVQIVNCTPGSALNSFPKMSLADALPVAA